MVAYKKLMFDFYPKLRAGEFVGELVSINKHELTETYDLRLPTDSLFVKVYGEVKLNYTVYKNNNVVMLNNFLLGKCLKECLALFCPAVTKFHYPYVGIIAALIFCDDCGY